MRRYRAQMSWSVWLSAWPIWSSPVMFGGGRQIVYFGFLLLASAMNRPSFSQRAYQPASMACGSKADVIAFGVLLMGVFGRAEVRSGVAGGRSLARTCRRGYGYELDSAHGG